MRVRQTYGDGHDEHDSSSARAVPGVPVRARLHGHVAGMYGAADEAESIATIHAALERGVNLIDTGDFYGRATTRCSSARRSRGRRDQALISVKFGALRGPDGGFLGFDARPAAVKNFLAYSLTRLGVDHIDIYRPARLDPAVPIEDTIGAIADLVKAGYVRHIGLSEVGADTIRRAARGAPDRRSPDRVLADQPRPRGRIFPTLARARHRASPPTACCRAACSPAASPVPGDFRAQPAAVHRRQRWQRTSRSSTRCARLAPSSRCHTCTTRDRVGTRERRRSSSRLVGARTRAQLDDALGALAIELSPGDILSLEQTIPASAVAGSRYQEMQMKHLDSER